MSAYKIINKYFKYTKLLKIYNDFIKVKPSVGIDGIKIDNFEKNIDNEIRLIENKFHNTNYDFSFYKEKLISKGRGKCPRVISIPTLRDKITLKTISLILSEVFSDSLNNELLHTKINSVKENISLFSYFIKIDIIDYYPTINHDILLSILKNRIRKKQFIDLIKKAIKQKTLYKSNKSLKKYQEEIGVPQGLSVSNILSSIYLSKIDMKYSSRQDLKYFRYVDDILILCDENSYESIYNEIKQDMNSLKLKIHELGKDSQKTEFGQIEDSFFFLGYKFSNTLVSIRQNSIENLHKSIINIFAQFKYSKTKNKDLLLWKLNLKITGCRFNGEKYGWLFFFSQITDITLLFKLDKFVESQFIKFNVPKSKKVKKFIRSYYEIIKNRTNTRYIPNFDNFSKIEKEEILIKTFGIKKDKIKDADSRFNFIIYKNIKQMEKDIQMY